MREAPRGKHQSCISDADVHFNAGKDCNGSKSALGLADKDSQQPAPPPLTQLFCTVGAELAIRLSGSFLVPTAARLAVLKV